MASLHSASNEDTSYLDAALVGETPGEMHGQLLVVTNEFSGERHPNIQREVALITCALRESSLIQVRRAALGDLALALTQHKDAIVAAHFAGHGLSEGFVLNVSSSPEEHYVLQRDLLADMFEGCTQLHCAFFNACWSDNIAASFQEHLAFSELCYTISVPGRICDEIAYTFTGVFYGQLAMWGNVEDAFGKGHELIGEAFSVLVHDGEAVPEIWVRPGTPEPKPKLRIGPPRTPLRFQVLLTMKHVRDRNDYADDIKDCIIRNLAAFQHTVMERHIEVVEHKTYWELKLDNSLDLVRTTEEQTQALKMIMEQTFPNDGVRFLCWRSGSLILGFCSSFETFQKMQAWQDSGDLSTVLGMPVLSLSEVGVAADVVVAGYVYARLCAYRTACPKEDVALQFGMPIALSDAEQPDVESCDAAASTGDLPTPASATQPSPIPGDATEALASASSPSDSNVLLDVMRKLLDDMREAVQVKQAARAMEERCRQH